jgi:DNA-binding CsgD family transcriptional regulator
MSHHNGILLAEDTKLDENELKVLQLVADGLTTEESAKAMFKSIKSIELYRNSAFAKLGANHIAHAVSIAHRKKLIE